MGHLNLKYGREEEISEQRVKPGNWVPKNMENSREGLLVIHGSLKRIFHSKIPILFLDMVYKKPCTVAHGSFKCRRFPWWGLRECCGLWEGTAPYLLFYSQIPKQIYLFRPICLVVASRRLIRE